MDAILALFDSDHDGNVDQLWIWGSLSFVFWVALFVVRTMRKRPAKTDMARVREHRMKARG